MDLFKDQVAIESIKLGLYFTIMLTPFFSYQNIITVVYQDQGYASVGPICLALSYLSFLVANSWACKVKWTFKTQLLLTGYAYLINMSIGIYAFYIPVPAIVYIIVIIGATIGGLSGGFLWVGVGGYLRQICKQKQNKGKYNAIFSFLVSFSAITAGLISTFFFGLFSNQIYFVSITTISALGWIYGKIFLKDFSNQSSTSDNKIKGKKNQEDFKNISQIQVENDQQYNKSILTVQNQNNDQLQHKNQRVQRIIQNSNPNLQVNQGKQSILQMIKNFFKQQKNNFYITRFALLFFLLDGICLGIQSNQLPKLIPTDESQKKLKEGILGIFLGVGSVIASSCNGPICDILGLKFAAKITLGSFLFVCLITIVGESFQAYWLACIIAFFWGFTYFLFEGWIYVSILKLFKGKLQAFAANKQIHCITMAGFQVFVVLTKNKVQLIWLMLFVIVLAIPCWYCHLKVDYSNDKFTSKKKLNPLLEDQSQGSSIQK